jgi:hypothetical protein
VNIYEPKKGNIMKYMTFCGGIEGDCASKSKKKIIIFVDQIYKKHSLESSGTSVLYIGCLVPKG